MADAPLVSVIVPTYNRAVLLQRTLRAVAIQDHRRIQLIVVDDGSEDETPEVVDRARAVFERRGIELISLKLDTNRGPGAARNEGLRLATGTLLAFLASDDLWRHDFLSTLIDLLDRHPHCGVAFCGHFGIDVDDRVFAVGSTDVGTDESEGELKRPFEKLILSFPFITSGALVRRSALEEVGWFDETLASWEDADLWLRIAKRFDFVFTLAPLASYRLHDGNITKRRREWFEYQLRVRLRHLGDVSDPNTRRLALAQLQRAQLLLQEQLLREGIRGPKYDSLLHNAYAPDSARYRAGKLAMRCPTRVSRWYASAVRGAGNCRRVSVAVIHAITLRT